ncbi:protein of unknown function [Bradyrhizobium vignae]|uniref:Uncharacterized protein n=1 Tax=Bradyrhizobium vignae TaxID=1549949 RepID=A0A2U3PZI0_9BRAD|nr:protein of unknown function [Bradyrhizobium vignae]
MVPGGGAGELPTPPVDPIEPPVVPTEPPLDPAEPPVACANETAGTAASARIMIVVLIEPVADGLAIANAPLPVNGRDQDLFRNKCRHSLKAREANHDDRSRSLWRAQDVRSRRDGADAAPRS